MATPHRFSFSTDTEIGGPKGNNDAWWVWHASYGKKQIYDEESPSPYLLPNEWIAGSVAQILRLPVPPFAIMRKNGTGRLLFTSLQFTPDETPPPDMEPYIWWDADPKLCTGIICFDLLIGNSDRAERNLSDNNPSSPETFFVYDHDDALSGRMFGDGKKRLAEKNDEFLIDGHCLVQEMDDASHLPVWVEKVQSIPDWYIQEVCDEAMCKGFTKTTAEAASKFLMHRKRNLGRLLSENIDKFPLLQSWGVVLA